MTAQRCHCKKLLPPPLAAGWGSLYPYTSDLLCMDFCRQQEGCSLQVLSVVKTPLVVDAWARALHAHPDQAFTRYVINGLRYGFRVGFNQASPLQSATANMGSACLHPAVITDYIRKELSLGRLAGPFPEDSPPCELHINRFGVIPKGHNTGKWRLITDLSFPPGRSVNDGIDPSLCSLSYITVDQVVEVAMHFGREALLAKVDIESAYRLIPVHPHDRPLQAVRWEGQLYVDAMLPFGLRSAPKIFNAVADALNWCLIQRGAPHVLHYLDDFIIVGPPHSSQCQESVAVLDLVCSELGVPIADHKRDGPTTCLVFLGIEIDTSAEQLRLPREKLQRLQSLLSQWGDRRACSRRELESLVGLLNHACKVVRSGRSFLRRMIDLLHCAHHPPRRDVPIRLNTAFRSDLAWWQLFVSRWNGISFLPTPSHLPVVEMATDASGSWGCGAWHQTAWFQIRWDSRSCDLPIMVKELIPIVLACATWGHRWSDHQVRCHCDNQAVVACLRSRTSKQKGVMHLLRSLVFVEAHFHFHLHPLYITTSANHLADDLSRDHLPSFLLKVPQADRGPSPVSRDLLDLLLDPQADWISRHWCRQFDAIFKEV